MGPGKRRRKRRPKRETAEYLASAKTLAGLVPSLRKYRHRKKLKPSEKSAIARRERQLKNIPFLFPVTKKQAKRLKGKVFLPGIRAIQLRGITTDAKVKISRTGDIDIYYKQGEQARHWVYWSLDRDIVRSRRGMRKAGEDAFAKMFPIEKVSEMAKAAFARSDVKEVRLWAHAGIVGDTFETLGAFIRWVNEKWSQGRYMGEQERVNAPNYSNPSDPGRWVNGIAILLEPQEYVQARKNLK